MDTGDRMDTSTSGIRSYDENMIRTLAGDLYDPDRYTDFVKAAFAEASMEVVHKWIDGSMRRTYYYTIPASWDTESSSLELDGRLLGITYLWTCCINGLVAYGRTWEQWQDLCALIEGFYTDESHHLILYVHNLAHDFQGLRRWVRWKEVRSRSERKPMVAITEGGIEYRCSYILTNKSLAMLGNDLPRHKVTKAVGDLDYRLIRHPGSEITNKELMYAVRDPLVVASWILCCIEDEGGITKIPLTSTGYVRRAVRRATIESEDKKAARKYRQFVRSLTMELTEYIYAKKAFAGGYTHGNALHLWESIRDVQGYDRISAYPAELATMKFPGSKGVWVPPEDGMPAGGWLGRVKLIGLRPRVSQDFYLSRSKCEDIVNGLYDNGRICRADQLTTYITSVDWDIIKDFYYIDEVQWLGGYRYDMIYLPRLVVAEILEYYAGKTSLKPGPDSSEDDVMRYSLYKAYINAIYGMCVTDSIGQPDVVYSDDRWQPGSDPDLEANLEKYNKSKTRFLSYLWGIFCTAWARRHLTQMILAVGNDHIYSDTDSDKISHPERHQDQIRQLNDELQGHIQEASYWLDIPLDAYMPKTPAGKIKPLGTWEHDADYKLFRAVRAKSYMYVDTDDHLSLTISGVNKKTAIPYLLDKYNGDKEAILEDFGDGWEIPPEHSGKLIHTYDDEEFIGVIEDKDGVRRICHERSMVHLAPAGYHMGLTSELEAFVDFWRSGYREITENI